MRTFASSILLAIPYLFAACSGDETQVSSASSGSSSSSSGIPGPCNPWGTWKFSYDDATAPCGLITDTVTITQNGDGSASVVFAGDDTMPVSMCSPNPEPGVYSTNATVSADGCSVQLKSHTSYCYSGESQCENRDVQLIVNGDSAIGTLLYERCWCTMGDPMPVGAAGQRMP